MSGVADTAKLLASLDLQDAMTPKLRTAIGGVSAAESRIGSLSSKVAGFASNLAGGASRALGTFTGRIKGLATAGAGLLGIGGIFGIGALFKSGLDEARDFGAEVLRLSKLTGLSIPVTSALASAMHHFGIDAATAAKVVGMAEKNLGVLTKTTKSALAYQKQFGLSLTDSNGRVLTFDQLLLRSADYFNNKSIPAQTKALALQKLYGRSWQDLIPILSAGRKGIADAEEEAKRLGLTLTQDNIDALIKSRDATRNWGTALAGLQLQLGLSFLPTLTELTQAATAFVSNHRGDIVAFFRNAVAVGKVAASTIGEFAGKLVAAWDSIPAGLRDLMLKAFVTDRAVKFLFGFSPISVALKAGEGLIGGLAGAVGKSLGSSLAGAGLGKLFVQPVFVTNPGFGAGGNLPNVLPAAGAAAEGAAGVAGAAGAGTLGAIGIVAIGIVLIPYLIAALLPRIPKNFTPNPTSTQFGASRPSFGSQPVIVKNTVGVIDNSPGARAERQAALRAALASASANARTAEHTEALNSGLNHKQERTIAKLEAIRAAAQRQADKRETTNVSTIVRLSAQFSVNDVTRSSTTQTTYRSSTGQYVS